MMTQDEPQPLYKAVIWPVTKRQNGSCYIRIPKEFAQLSGIAGADMIELSIWRLLKKEEKKK